MPGIVTGIPEPAWDQVIAALGGGVLQSRAWAGLQQAYGRPAYHARREDWAWLGHARRGRGVRYLYVPCGPVVRSSGSGMATALESLAEAGRSLGADFVRFEPAGPATPATLRGHRARRVPDVQPQRTLLLDLTQSERALRSGVSRSNRNLINTSGHRGIRFRVLDRPGTEDIDQFVAMMRETAARGAFHPHPEGYYRQTIEVLSAARAATLYLADVGGRPVAGAVALDFAGTRSYAHAAAFPDLNREHRAAAPLLWRMIVDARGRGARVFDFWGIAPNDDPDHPWAGFTRFKRSFGGQVKEYAGSWELPLRRVKYHLYRAAKAILRRAPPARPRVEQVEQAVAEDVADRSSPR